MEDKILLNDLLHLSEQDIKRAKVKFNVFNGDVEPINEYKSNPDIVNKEWMLWHKKNRYFSAGSLAIGLVRISGDFWLFTCVLEIDKLLNVSDPEVGDIGYEAHDYKDLRKYFGRVIVKYHKSTMANGRWFNDLKNDMEVIEVLNDEYKDDHFPGYDNIRLPYQELKRIIDRDLPEWRAALENQKGVYLITDRHTGKMYVGSATSKTGMLFQRWKSYAANGHGGNKELINLVRDQGFEYVKQNFTYSLLENYNSKVDDHFILKRESWWKDTLLTRQFGYNDN